MRKHAITWLALGSLLATACSESPTAVEELPPGAAATLKAGELFSFIAIDKPSTRSITIAAGGSYQMSATLHYNQGGILSAVPYASWRSSDNCVASVTSAYPSFGLVKGLASGKTSIIAEAWGKADTVTVTVEGSSPPPQSCYQKEWSWDFTDVSFTGSPAESYSVAAGETLKRLVLFAGPKPDYTIPRGGTVRLVSELWYNKGGKLNGRGYVSFSVTDGSVASINAKGVVTGKNTGRTKVIARLGSSFADTVPLYVR